MPCFCSTHSRRIIHVFIANFSGKSSLVIAEKLAVNLESPFATHLNSLFSTDIAVATEGSPSPD